MLASGLVTVPAQADDIPACGGLYSAQYNRCILPTGLVEYAVEMAGGSGGAGSKTDVSIPYPYAKIAGVNGGRGRLHVINMPNSGSQSEMVIGIGHQGRNGLLSNHLTEIAGGVAAEGSQGGASWGGRDFDGSSFVGSSGGSGGGASDIRTVASNPSTRLFVVGGGGGGGAANFSLHEGGQGGDAESNGNSGWHPSSYSVQSGASLGLGTAGRCPFSGLGGAGGAGTQNSGGGGGGSGCYMDTISDSSVGTAGTVGQAGGDVRDGYGGRPGIGGIGGANGQGRYAISGGAGGGGYFGGGAGGDGSQYGSGGGGGGGSSLIPSNAELVNSDWNIGDGYAIISAITSSLPNVQQSVNGNFHHQLGVTGFSTSSSQVGLNVTYAMIGQPLGLSINPSTGLISGTFQEAGDFTVRVTASAGWPNGGIIRSTQQFTLAVSKISQTSSLSISKTMKKKSSNTFSVANLTTSAGQKIVLDAKGACSLKATYKKLKTKVGKKTKYVKTLSGYKITMGKKAGRTCTVLETAGATTSFNALSKSTVITIK